MSEDRGPGPDEVTEALARSSDGRHRRPDATLPAADVTITLLTRLAESAVTSGNLKTAIEAVRAASVEAENLYRIAMHERGAAAAAARAAATDRAEAAALRAEALAELEAHRKAGQRKQAVPRRPRRPAGDVAGQDLRPDPSKAQTPGEFIDALKRFRVWAGNPSFRDLAKRCGERGPVASTIFKLLERDQLPARFDVVDAVIVACGGTDEDRQRFATAWRRLTLPERKNQPVSVLHAVPRPSSA